VTVTAWATVAAFLLLAVLATRLWLQHRTAAAAWLAGAFGLLGAAVLVGQVVPDEAPFAANVASTAVAVTGVLAFPYLLFRFAAGFGGVPVALRRVADVAAAVILVGTVALVPAFAPPDVDPAWFPALLYVILVYWTLLSAWVAVPLWRAGRARPTVARRRMRVLAVGSGLMNLAVFVSIVGPAESAVATIVARSIAIVAAGGFYLAFSPPGLLRREWRRDEERTLRGAPLDVLRADGHVEAVEAVLPRVAQLFGTGQAAFCDVDRRTIATFGDDDVGDVAAAIDDAQARHTVEQHGDWVVLRLGTGWLGVRTDLYAPFFGAEEMELLGSLGAFLDLALERVDLLAVERQAKAEIEVASREIETLLYGISHDLRNPLVSVLGYLDVLEKDSGEALGEDGRRHIERLRANAHYMDALIRDLLELSRIGRTERGSASVALEQLVRELGTELRRDHPAATVEVGPLPVVDMNPVRARQLFANLIGNALVHGGRDDIAVSVESARTNGTHAEVVVSDNGGGIPEPYRERVFKIFERLEAREEREGTGVGLAICRRIVEQVGGRIWIGDAAPGTAVHIELPQPSHAERAPAGGRP
jgi:signal transduction histidine kinase